jgi:hypothetical protein
MKKLFFLLMLIVIGIANAKAQKSTINTLFPNKATEVEKLKAKAEPSKKDVSTPTKQRLFQNYSQGGAQRALPAVANRKAVANVKTASASEYKPDKSEPKAAVKLPPMQQESTTKQ